MRASTRPAAGFGIRVMRVISQNTTLKQLADAQAGEGNRRPRACDVSEVRSTVSRRREPRATPNKPGPEGALRHSSRDTAHCSSITPTLTKAAAQTSNVVYCNTRRLRRGAPHSTVYVRADWYMPPIARRLHRAARRIEGAASPVHRRQRRSQGIAPLAVTRTGRTGMQVGRTRAEPPRPSRVTDRDEADQPSKYHTRAASRIPCAGAPMNRGTAYVLRPARAGSPAARRRTSSASIISPRRRATPGKPSKIMADGFGMASRPGASRRSRPKDQGGEPHRSTR